LKKTVKKVKSNAKSDNEEITTKEEKKIETETSKNTSAL